MRKLRITHSLRWLRRTNNFESIFDYLPGKLEVAKIDSFFLCKFYTVYTLDKPSLPSLNLRRFQLAAHTIFPARLAAQGAAYSSFSSLFSRRRRQSKGCACCQVFDKSGMLMPEGVIIGYCILYTVYKGISTIMRFCQVFDLGDHHLRFRLT